MKNRFNAPKVLKAKYGSKNKSECRIHAVIMINGEERILLCNHNAISEGCQDAKFSQINCGRCLKRMEQIVYEQNMKCHNCGEDMKFTLDEDNENPQFSCEPCGVWHNV